ncbi:MAG: hypothetical protein IH589_12765 [Anaerolineales bacterium]|nr:hypothetical protein [Anaerolineales bacterium]
MNIDNKNLKMFNLVIIVVLAGILVTAFGGILMQRQNLPLSENGIGADRSSIPIQPESAQSGPNGKLVLSTGIILLLVGFGFLIVTLWVGLQRLRHYPN